MGQSGLRSYLSGVVPEPPGGRVRISSGVGTAHYLALRRAEADPA